MSAPFTITMTPSRAVAANPVDPPAVELGPAEEHWLVQQAAGGDRAAFGELYRRYARMVHGILLTRVPVSEAEDLVQEVFLSAMRQLASLRDPGAFRGWLAAIARNKAMDYHRERREHTERGTWEEAQTAAGGASARAEALRVLDRIRQLPEAYRETLILRLVEGLTGPEIAQQTGLRPESVRVNLCRGMKMLRHLLDVDGDHRS
jgi:RNA polymerase sigma-70 factor, ECF subfamily